MCEDRFLPRSCAFSLEIYFKMLLSISDYDVSKSRKLKVLRESMGFFLTEVQLGGGDDGDANCIVSGDARMFFLIHNVASVGTWAGPLEEYVSVTKCMSLRTDMSNYFL